MREGRRNWNTYVFISLKAVLAEELTQHFLTWLPAFANIAALLCRSSSGRLLPEEA